MNNVKIPAEVYSRVSGYYRPVKQWNRGKQSEHADRINLKLPELKDEVSSNKM